MKVLYEEFDNLRSLESTLKSRSENVVFKGTSCSSQSTNKNFTRTSSWDEAIELFHKGWDEPLEKIKKGIAKNFKSNVFANKVRPCNDVVGYAPCVPNAIMGLPHSMISTQRTPSKVKAVSITYSMSATCDYSEEQILQSGIVVLNIINDLELQGYRVKLNLEFMATRKGNDLSIVRVCVKDWRQPLDIKKLTFPIAHPSMFRRLGFRWLETVPNLKNRGYGVGYGSSSFKYDYKNACRIYKENNLLKENEFFITSYLCIDDNYDKEKIIKEVGMEQLLIKKGA